MLLTRFLPLFFSVLPFLPLLPLSPPPLRPALPLPPTSQPPCRLPAWLFASALYLLGMHRHGIATSRENPARTGDRCKTQSHLQLARPPQHPPWSWWWSSSVYGASSPKRREWFSETAVAGLRPGSRCSASASWKTTWFSAALR